jgi:predicted CoA-binding protein
MTAAYKSTIEAFLRLKNIAVLGYSSHDDQPANAIYKKLKDNGYQVFAVNPKADLVKEVPCYPDLKSIAQPIEGVVLCTPAHATEQAVRNCAELGIAYVWIHRGMGEGSYDEKAFQTARKLGLHVIPGGCPMMYVKPDPIHWCARYFMSLPT